MNSAQVDPKLSLISKYKEEIEEVIGECEHVYRLTIDYDLLDKKVSDILADASDNGIQEKIIWDIIQARIPSYVNYKNCKSFNKKAA